MWTVLEIPTGPPVRGRQLWRKTENFLLKFLQFHVYDLRLRQFFLLYWVSNTGYELRVQWMFNTKTQCVSMYRILWFVPGMLAPSPLEYWKLSQISLLGPWYWLWIVFYLTLSLQVKLSSLNLVCAYIAVLFLEILVASKFENPE